MQVDIVARHSDTCPLCSDNNHVIKNRFEFDRKFEFFFIDNQTNLSYEDKQRWRHRIVREPNSIDRLHISHFKEKFWKQFVGVTSQVPACANEKPIQIVSELKCRAREMRERTVGRQTVPFAASWFDGHSALLPSHVCGALIALLLECIESNRHRKQMQLLRVDRIRRAVCDTRIRCCATNRVYTTLTRCHQTNRTHRSINGFSVCTKI